LAATRQSIGSPHMPGLPHWHSGKDAPVTRIGPPSGPHMHWLQRLRPLADILSHCAHDLSYNEFRTDSWCAAFYKVALATLNTIFSKVGRSGSRGYHVATPCHSHYRYDVISVIMTVVRSFPPVHLEPVALLFPAVQSTGTAASGKGSSHDCLSENPI
jgi:hypothetical protein